MNLFGQPGVSTSISKKKKTPAVRADVYGICNKSAFIYTRPGWGKNQSPSKMLDGAEIETCTS
jgi:hypothetical protein